MPPERPSFRSQLAAKHREVVNTYLGAHRDKERLRASLHLLLGALLSHCSADNVRADGRATCWPSLATIARLYGFHPRSVRRMLRALEESGAVWVIYGAGVSGAAMKAAPQRQRHLGSFIRRDGSWSARRHARTCSCSPSRCLLPRQSPRGTTPQRPLRVLVQPRRGLRRSLARQSRRCRRRSSDFSTSPVTTPIPQGLPTRPPELQKKAYRTHRSRLGFPRWRRLRIRSLLRLRLRLTPPSRRGDVRASFVAERPLVFGTLASV